MSLLDGNNLVPIILMLANMLAIMDRINLQDALGAFASTADRRAASLVLQVAGGGGLLGLGKRVGGDGAQGQECHEGSSRRHVG